MATYRVPVVIKGHVVVKYPDGKAVGDYMGGLPRDAEQEVLMQPAPFVCGARMEDCAVELAGSAEIVREQDPTPKAAPSRPVITLGQVFAGR